MEEISKRGTAVVTVMLLAGASGVSARAAEDVWTASSQWISAAGAVRRTPEDKAMKRAATGANVFRANFVNASAVRKAEWTVSGLGVFEAYVNGSRVGDDFLKPGTTQRFKRKIAFRYDVTPLLKTRAGETNVLSAVATSGWWCDAINDFGDSSVPAFRAELSVEHADGTRWTFPTDSAHWSASTHGPVVRAGIYDGEIYDARIPLPHAHDVGWARPVVNTNFSGVTVLSDGGEITLRRDLALVPVAAFCWKGVEGRDREHLGKVVRTRTFAPGETLVVEKGETLVVDFGQNSAAVPRYRFRSCAGSRMTALGAEVLNDACGALARGNDGPEGSVYRDHLSRGVRPTDNFRNEYVFADGEWTEYLPRFTYFGYRYLSITASERLEIARVESVPVTSIRKEHEIGRIETGVSAVNRLISNILWTQRSNYLSVPTDCAQRDERHGWSGDGQVFCESASFNADTTGILRKWLRDLRDSEWEPGAPSVVSPPGNWWQAFRFGWTDAVVIVPYRVWRQFGDTRIVRENFALMDRFLTRIVPVDYATEAFKRQNHDGQYSDWLCFEKAPDERRFWNFLAASHCLSDLRMAAAMAPVAGRDPAHYRQMAEQTATRLKARYFTGPEGSLSPDLAKLQTALAFALQDDVMGPAAKAKTCADLRENLRAHGDCLQTGILGTPVLLEELARNGMNDLACTLLLQTKNPSWLFEVENGATTVWERWNSYDPKVGLASVKMNSFNHPAFCTVLAWMYRHLAGIAPDERAPGFKRIVMAPKPDRRLGFVKAEYRSAAGLVTSFHRYEGDSWIWDFSVPEGTSASVTVPGETRPEVYGAGEHRIVRKLDNR